MTSAVPHILARIVEHKHAEMAPIAGRRQELERRAADAVHSRRPFRAALEARRPAIIAEIKKASPSKGLLAPSFDPAAIATGYEQGGAAALSVLTDERFFQGSLADLETARASVTLPVLRKDFTIDELHVIEAAAHGADAILLIAAVLDADALRRLRELAAQYAMDAIVEVHDEQELEAALASGAPLIGVNNRDLCTFEVRIETSLRLAERIPAGILKISESGIERREQIERLQDAGYGAFLVGEHLMRAGNAREALRQLCS